MKAHSIRLAVLLLAAVLVIACSWRQYRARPKEEIYGSWVCDTSHTRKIIMHPDGTYEEFLHFSDKEPYYVGVFEIVAKRADSKKDIYYKVNYVMKRPTDFKYQELSRISQSGEIWEFVYSHVTGFEKENRPIAIDEESASYERYRRVK